MSTVYDARKPLVLTGRAVMLDTNIWMLVEAFGSNHRQDLQQQYSSALKQLRQNGCTLATNDYVLSEFFNAACKIEYNIQKDSSNNPKTFPKFKTYRQTDKLYIDFMETIRDTCIDILNDCSFACVSTSHNIEEVLKEVATGSIDFSDVILREHCKEMNYVVMTHDGDFLNCGLDVITANPKLL